jgi:hypothetical protein
MRRVAFSHTFLLSKACPTLLSRPARTMAADAARTRMFDELRDGAGAGAPGDASNKVILTRGCDPVMAARAAQMMPPLVGGAQFVGVTDDEELFRLLESGRKFDVVWFAPGACRWDASRRPIPGGNKVTHGWGLDKYRDLVRKHLGNEVPIVEAIEERDVVPRLRKALGLSA